MRLSMCMCVANDKRLAAVCWREEKGWKKEHQELNLQMQAV